MYSGAKIPANFLPCDGRELLKTAYAQLFNAIGITYGESADKLKFKIPDLRGCFVRCVGGNAAKLGLRQGDAIRNITGKFGADDRMAYILQGCFFNAGWSDTGSSGSGGGNTIGFDASKVVPTANENRPLNMAMNFIIQIKE